jgi:DNA-binding NarL/FixJ family response regulator
LAVAEAIASRIGVAYPDVPERHPEAVALLLRSLGEPAFTAAWAAGGVMPIESAVAEGLVVFDADNTDAPPAESHGLTPRQIEVLHLLAEGKSDREIAEALFVSHRTAMTHVARILARLDVPSRSAAVAYAFRHGLI